MVHEISGLVTSPSEELARRDAVHLHPLIEYAPETWMKAILLVAGPRSQPDFSISLRRMALTKEQYDKLRPFHGEWSDRSASPPDRIRTGPSSPSMPWSSCTRAIDGHAELHCSPLRVSRRSKVTDTF